jgi:hypothetical protein
MTTKTKTLIGCLIVRSVLNDVNAYQLLKRYRVLKDRNEKYEADLKYLVDILNRNDIRLTEFDRIALNSIKQKSS